MAMAYAGKRVCDVEKRGREVGGGEREERDCCESIQRQREIEREIGRDAEREGGELYVVNRRESKE